MTLQQIPRIVFIGASGEMCRVAVKAIIKAIDCKVLLADIRPEVIKEFASGLEPGRATVQKLDLFDHAALSQTIQGADLVVLGAGPYIRTAGPVMEACLEAKVPYLDFDDDVESTEHALSMDAKAKEAGIPFFIGCGASPGLTNILAADAASDLDEINRLDVNWMIGHESSVGRAVLEHMVHISVGECVTWEGGRRAVHESMVATERFPIIPGRPDMVMYETAHPEPVTLCRKFSKADRIRCYGGLDPLCQCGLSRGIGLAIRDGRMSHTEAIDMMLDVANGGYGTLAGWRAALGGAISQIRRGEATWGALIKYMIASIFNFHLPYQGGLMAQAYGTKNGKPAVSGRRMTMQPPLFSNLGGATGLACAAFALVALESPVKYTGTLAPEDWAEPQSVYNALARVGVPLGTVHTV